MDPVIRKTSASGIDVPYQTASLDIWDKKYRLKSAAGEIVDETIDDTFRRVARALADQEATESLRDYYYEEFLQALQRGALPAGRILANAGALDYKAAVSTINCTVSGTIGDSMNDILEKLQEAGLTLKSGCGIGYEFSTLRPKGAGVSGAGAHTSGPVSFMEIYDRMCFTIRSAGGRRGAQMATFDVGHPDVLEFIQAKREHGRLRQFNQSLLITGEFMQAVEKDEQWPLAFPLTRKEAEEGNIDTDNAASVIWRRWPLTDPYITDAAGRVACRVYQWLPARELWDTIMATTYDYGEPGFILIDRYNEMNNNWFCEDIRATNPCIVADTWVQTSAGPRRVFDLIGKPFHARVNGTDYRCGPEGFFKTGRKPVVRLRTVEGFSLRLTADHPVKKVTYRSRWRLESEWFPAGSLVNGDEILLNDHRDNTEWPGRYGEGEGYLMGLLVGDGTLKRTEAVLSIWKPAVSVNGPEADFSGVEAMKEAALGAVSRLNYRADFSGWTEVRRRGEYRLTLTSLAALATEFGMAPGHKTITPEIESESSDFYRGFLRGLFDTDGSVQGMQKKGISIRLSQSNPELLEAAQRMLLRSGIMSTIYRDRRPEGTTLLPDGKGSSRHYSTKAQHELVISGENAVRFSSVIGFVDTVKANRLLRLIKNYKRSPNRERFIVRVDSVEKGGEEDVYDIRVPVVHSFDANGMLVHNCGEQGLPPYGSCLLGSVNLTRFVNDPFTSSASFDWEEFRRIVKIFTRMLDNVVAINGLPLPQQRESIERTRRHGMGFLGLGSSLAMLGYCYGDADSVAFTERAARELAVTGWETALELAKEKGPAPILEEEFTITEGMLELRPALRRDGYKAGDRVPGRILHAHYSRYMEQIAEVVPELVEELAQVGARFTHHSSIAPTGTIALSLGNNASNGIEPSFAHRYSRNVIREGRKAKERVEVNSYELLAYRHRVDAEAVPEPADSAHRLPDHFVTADDVSPEQHLAIQAAAQKWIDSSISKTINIPSQLPFEEFKHVYRRAYEQGLKGCTTFRFNPEVFQGVLVRDKDLEGSTYRFRLEDGTEVLARGSDMIEYEGEMHTAANLYDALKEGYYGRF